MAFRCSLLPKLMSRVLRDDSKAFSRFPLKSMDDVGYQTTFPQSEDGIIKKSGLLLDKYTTIDGKPVYPGKYKRIKLSEGTLVHAGTMLYHQKRLDCHPGLNVGVGRDLTLFALEDGVVYITCEKCYFNFQINRVRRFYFDQRGVNVYKMYYHVITKEQPQHFKLISLT